jgi:hypothetical protein
VGIGAVHVAFLPLSLAGVVVHHHMVFEVDLLDVVIVVVLVSIIPVLDCRLLVVVLGVVNFGNDTFCLLFLGDSVEAEAVDQSSDEDNAENDEDYPNGNFIQPETVNVILAERNKTVGGGGGARETT